MAEVEFKIFDKVKEKKQEVYFRLLEKDTDHDNIYLVACDENMETLYGGCILGINKNTGKFFRLYGCYVPGLALDAGGKIIEEDE